MICLLFLKGINGPDLSLFEASSEGSTCFGKSGAAVERLSSRRGFGLDGAEKGRTPMRRAIPEMIEFRLCRDSKDDPY